MKVEQQRLQGPAEAYRSARWDRIAPRGVKESRGPAQADQVDFSDRAQEASSLRRALRQVPEIRADRVAALKAQVEAGLYRVRTAELANRLLQGQEVEA